MANTNYSLPVFETLQISWSKVHGSKSTIWGALLLMMVIMMGLGICNFIIMAVAKPIQPVVNVFMQIIGLLFGMGLLYIGIKRAQDLPISYNQIFRAFDNWLWVSIIAVYILEVLIMIIPIMCTIACMFLYALIHTPTALVMTIILSIAGIFMTIYLAVRMMLSMAFVIDKETGPWESIKLSFRATQSNFWKLIGIFLLLMLIVFISAIPLGIGLIWTIPFKYINYGMIYKNLSLNNLHPQ